MSKIARMMSLYGVSLENDDARPAETLAPVEGASEPMVVEVEPLSSEDTEAGAAAEMVESAQEVTEVSDVVEELEEAHAGLEALRLDLIIDRKAGGLSVQAARGYTHAINAYTGRFGMSAPTVSTEAFGGAVSRLQATISLEADLGKKLRDMVNAAIAALKALWQKVVNFMKNLFDTAKRTLERAEQLKAQSAKFSGVTKEGVKIKLPASLHVGGKVPRDYDVVTLSLYDAAKAIMKTIPKEINLLSGQLVGALKGLNYDADNLAESIAVQCGDLQKPIVKIPETLKLTVAEGANATRFGDNVKVWIGKELFGGKALIAVTPASKDGSDAVTPQSLGKISIGIQNIDGEQADVKDSEIEPVDSMDLLTITGDVIGICKAIIDSRGIYDNFTRTIDQVKAAGDGVAKNVDSSEKLSADDKAAANALVMAAIGVMQRAATGAGKSSGYLLSTCRTLLDVCAASAKAHTLKTPEQAKADADRAEQRKKENGGK